MVDGVECRIVRQGVWVYGCRGVWVYGCMGVGVYGCIGSGSRVQGLGFRV
jgi:hypothetical protein